MRVKKKTGILILTYALALALALTGWGLTERRRAQESALAVQMGYQRAFGELVTSLTELDTALQKSLYATSPALAGALCTEAFGKAMTAQMSLGVLPFSTEELTQTAGFISRAGDYAFMLSRAAAGGESYTAEQRENLAALSDTAGILAQNMRQLQTDVSDGVLRMEELTAAEQRMDTAESALPRSLPDAMRLIEQEFPEIPSLIYDGPFSEHLDQAEALFLQDKAEFSKEEALMEARMLLGENSAGLRCVGRTEGKIPTWDFEGKCAGGEVYISMTVQGGKPLSMLCSRSVTTERLSAEEGVKIAALYLQKHGFWDMESSYTMRQDGVLTVNFAPKVSGVLLYPDLVKVGVALDDGSIVSLETRGYLMNHRSRSMAYPAVTEAQAATRVAEGLVMLGHRLCLIPRTGGEEKLCHEFTCEAEDGRHYIVYVDAYTGEQEKILILLEDESGSLTI